LIEDTRTLLGKTIGNNGSLGCWRFAEALYILTAGKTAQGVFL